MSTPLIEVDVENLVIEDDKPVENIYSEKQARLLTEPLYSCWEGPGDGRPFLAAGDVGVFHSVHQPPVVPDVFLSLDVPPPPNFSEKKNRSYFIWETGKSPEVAIEIVSNREGEETGRKFLRYAAAGIFHYVVFDPLQCLGGPILTVHDLVFRKYVPRTDTFLPSVNLSLKLWEGEFEGVRTLWLRWCDAEGNPIPTGAERAEQERGRAEQAERRARQEHDRAERLAAKLRELGIDPETP